MISGLKSDSYEERLKELGLTSLEERRHRADMALVHSVMHGKTEIDVDEWFTKAATGNRATRTATGRAQDQQDDRKPGGSPERSSGPWRTRLQVTSKC